MTRQSRWPVADEATSPVPLVRSPLRLDARPEPAEGVEVCETHISWVFLVGQRVYKCKKPVRFAFLDYGTPELRRQACEQEVRLNRRLAPNVYLGVADLTARPDGGLQAGGDGPVVDSCVVMSRLPAERMLDRLIVEQRAATWDIERLLDVLIPFYAGAARGPQIDREAALDRLLANARENFTTLDATDHGLPRSLLQRLRAAQLGFLQFSAKRFAQRLASGYVCEGHGDLRPEHVCLLDPPVVFDCVEFSLGLRAADVLSELAFLAMECTFLGAPALAETLLSRYRQRSGDPAPEALAAFYQSYRACIRAKVNLLRAAQQPEGEAAHSRHRARRYLQLAGFCTTGFHRPQLLVTIGATGSGKSTVAAALADALGLEVLRTDVIRHELAGGPPADEATLAAQYTEAMTQRTYDVLAERARVLLGEAVSVVLDGTFRRVEQRERAVRLAHECGAGVHFIVCWCPPDVARRRIAERRARGTDASDATPELHEAQLAELQDAAAWSGPDVLTVDTTDPLPAVVEQILDHLRGRLAT
jgi:aminoglycoside phosphotransferase family enzyme/predicted kinase